MAADCASPADGIQGLNLGLTSGYSFIIGVLCWGEVKGEKAGLLEERDPFITTHSKAEGERNGIEHECNRITGKLVSSK